MNTHRSLSTEEILAKLVSFPIFGGESNVAIIRWIDHYLTSHGVKTHLAPDENGTKINLHCRIGPAAEGGIILSGHTDVVPVEGQAWETDPFVLTDGGDGRLYGRGSCDMKGFLACCLQAVPTMVAADLKKPIYLAFSYDEETGCEGAPPLIEDIQSTYTEQPQFAIIGEPSMMQPVIGQKGIFVLSTEVNGSAGHSSRIRQEVSAVHEAARLIIWLEDKMDRLVGAKRLDDRFDPPHSSIHAGTMSGGIATNVIADQARFTWDVRVIPGDSALEILSDFREHCRQREEELKIRFSEFRIRTEIVHQPVPPLDTSPDSEVLSLVQKLTGNEDWTCVSYATEAGQYAEGGFEAIICGPGSIEQAHRANEYIEKDQLRKGEEMIRTLIHHCSR